MKIHNREFTDVVNMVNEWAKDNASVDYYYGTRQSYWAEAMRKGIITQNQYQDASAYYGNLWTYRGD